MQTASHVKTFSEHDVSEDDAYYALLAGLWETGPRKGPTAVFTTDAGEGSAKTGTEGVTLFDVFLAHLPVDRRQHYTCHTCRRFVNHYGGLATVDDDGHLVPLLWNSATVPPFFRASVAAVEREVRRAKITGVFLASEDVWGTRSTPDVKHNRVWSHMATEHAAVPYEKSPWFSALRTPEQRAAELRQDFETLCRGLADYPADVVTKAHSLLSGGQLARSEKHLGVATWLKGLHEIEARGQARTNLLWRAAVLAPAGFCHVKSTMIGTLLDDITAGLSFEQIKRRFADKMDPLQYQRPTAAPSDGVLAEAERAVATLKSAGALARRFATLDDIETLWTPKAPNAPAPGGVFAHLRTTKAIPDDGAPPVVMTWEKFHRTVLPTATAIEVLIPARGNFAAFVTAVNPDAPPILQWDRPEKRNPVSWYLYANVGGSLASQWNLTAGVYRPLTAICYHPPMWHGLDMPHHGKAIHLLIDGARDVHYAGSGLFFPETLKSDYHPIRAAMEAYAKAGRIEGAHAASACGLRLQGGQDFTKHLLRVTTGDVRKIYTLDRWD